MTEPAISKAGRISRNSISSFPNSNDVPDEVPNEVLNDPALLFLYYRIEQILGIKARAEALKNLNKYMEETCAHSFIENPSAYEYLLTSREQIFIISKIVTINETYFFREEVHFDLLSEILPEFSKLNRPVQICCAAVSIGCEAYSIAMLIDQHIKNGMNIDYSIDAFDVNNEVIESAKNACYSANTIRNDGSRWRYILNSYISGNDSEFTISADIRKKINFFPHNIMRGLEKQYDIIFFRNALIYFTSKNRQIVINNLVESLFHGGYLFLGISETSSVKHPLLTTKFSSDAFYFRKTAVTEDKQPPFYRKKESVKANKTFAFNTGKKTAADSRTAAFKQNEIQFNLHEVSEILKKNDGKENAETIAGSLNSSRSFPACCLAAAVIYFLHTQDYKNADETLSALEKSSWNAYSKFLRGEYFFLLGNNEEAEMYFNEASVMNKSFWPAYYRIASLSAGGNRTRYEYKIKKTIESIELFQNTESNKDISYECFMGGFSPDYFLRILEKKLA